MTSRQTPDFDHLHRETVSSGSLAGLQTSSRLVSISFSPPTFWHLLVSLFINTSSKGQVSWGRRGDSNQAVLLLISSYFDKESENRKKLAGIPSGKKYEEKLK